MSKSMLYMIIFFNTLIFNAYCQERLKTEFYDITIPENTIVKKFNSSHEDLANIDVYEFLINEKTKYIGHFMSNKLNIYIVSVDLDNYKDFLFDLGELNITAIENINGKVKISFSYFNNEHLRGIIYASISGDILNRYVFLFPVQNVKDMYQKEVDNLVFNVIELKHMW